MIPAEDDTQPTSRPLGPATTGKILLAALVLLTVSLIFGPMGAILATFAGVTVFFSPLRSKDKRWHLVDEGREVSGAMKSLRKELDGE